ncbi:SusF/SusE family outer membrane protein [Draconibacterium sp.]|uniref:SusF/SusE family outer membrane protein n=1 Tax=Draconibacterium sp. TaxID=1965318 RepID=UPI00262B2416|nr:SusF/SusE family outer membrane protein [uncultured Draconibacterium sp.]
MKNFRYKNNNCSKRNYMQNGMWISVLVVIAITLLNSCQKEEDVVVALGAPIAISVSNSELTLSQKQASESVFSFSWTRGTNHGTSSSISYSLEMDMEGNEFATAQIYDLGKGVYEKKFNAEELNDLLLNYWGVEPGSTASFEAKVTANVVKEGVEDGVSETLIFSLTPYKPVSEELYMVGSATPNGWDIGNATPLIPNSSQPWVFTYEGQMKTGTFKFAVNTDGCWCQDFYTKDANDDSKMVYNEGGSGDDLQWEIIEGGNYKLTVNLLDLSIEMKKLAGPEFGELYIVGDASPSGWNIGNPEAFTQSAADPFVFTYEAMLTPGEFKISTFAGDWCDGQWINPSQPDQDVTATDYIVTNRCDGPDNKWRVTEETQGRYLITVNLYNNSIKIERVMLYIIGDGGPNGWNIGTPEPMTIVNGIYVFEGELGADNPTGEFKISKFKGDWCNGDWINAANPNQSISNTDFITTHGCDGPDNKWKLQDGDAGTYRISIDLEADVLTIEKQ